MKSIVVMALGMCKHIFRKLYYCFDALQVPRNVVWCLLHGFRPDFTWRFYGVPYVRKGGRGSSIKIGIDFRAVSKISRNSFGIIQRVVIRTVGHGAKIEIGNDVGISGCTISAAKSITIGSHVLIGSGALICDSDAHPIDPIERRKGSGGASRPIVIENDVFIGARAIILKGVRIGRGSVIGAGAVVAKDIPPYSIAVGNPAKVIGDCRGK